MNTHGIYGNLPAKCDAAYLLQEDRTGLLVVDFDKRDPKMPIQFVGKLKRHRGYRCNDEAAQPFSDSACRVRQGLMKQ